MSLIFSESFDLFSPPQLVASGKFTASDNSPSQTSGPTGTAGRTGYCWRATSSTQRWLDKLLPAADHHATFIVGMARLWTSMAGTNNVLSLHGDNGSTEHIVLSLNASGFLEVWRGPSRTTLLGTASEPITINLWYHIELKVTMSEITGAVDLRINGVNRLSLTNQDTRNAGTNASFSFLRFWLGNNSVAISDRCDDIYVCNGAGSVNNDFLGDVRVEALLPNADGNYSQWEPRNYNRLPSPNVSGIETDATGWFADVNAAAPTRTTVAGTMRTGTGALAVTPTASGTMSIRTASGTSGFPVAGSTAYMPGVWSKTASTGRAVGVGLEWYDNVGAIISRTALTSPGSIDAGAYGLFQSATSFTSPSTAVYAALVVQWTAANEEHHLDDAFVVEASLAGTNVTEPGGMATHHTALTDYVPSATSGQQDMSYVVSGTNDQLDTWGHSDPTSPASQPVFGVIQYAQARTDTPSAKSIAMVSRLATVDATSGDLAVPQTYVAGSGMVKHTWELDPAGATWTIPNITDAEFGVKLRP